MKVIFVNILLLSLIYSVSEVSGQKIEYIKVPELEKILKNPEDKLFVVNLWATWCAPCVAELPAFEKTAGDYDKSKVRFLMVSLDFPSQIEKQLKPFLLKNKITLDVAVMMDVDYDSWIGKVDPQWQGNIPATLIFNNKEKIRYFHSGELSETELRGLLNKFL
jgi:thiol-disulfide isomerase/thioredoxin